MMANCTAHTAHTDCYRTDCEAEKMGVHMVLSGIPLLPPRCVKGRFPMGQMFLGGNNSRVHIALLSTRWRTSVYQYLPNLPLGTPELDTLTTRRADH